MCALLFMILVQFYNTDVQSVLCGEIKLYSHRTSLDWSVPRHRSKHCNRRTELPNTNKHQRTDITVRTSWGSNLLPPITEGGYITYETTIVVVSKICEEKNSVKKKRRPRLKNHNFCFCFLVRKYVGEKMWYYNWRSYQHNQYKDI